MADKRTLTGEEISVIYCALKEVRAIFERCRNDAGKAGQPRIYDQFQRQIELAEDLGALLSSHPRVDVQHD